MADCCSASRWWPSGHPFLHQWARGDEGLGTGRQHVPVPERDALRELSDAERRAWSGAVAFASRAGMRRRNLWPALIFATAGMFTQTVASADGLPPHTPYWIREGLEEFCGWSALVTPVMELWAPIVRGERSRADAFAALVDHFESGD